MLKHYRTMIRKPGKVLPDDLSLLDMDVSGRTEDVVHCELWGRTEGVIFDDDRDEVVFFVVRFHPADGFVWCVFVSLDAVEILYPEGSRSLSDAVLRVDWTPE